MKDKIVKAFERIGPHLRYTPLEYSINLSKETNSEAYFKLENYQLSGSFKIRGAMNKILSVPEKQRKEVTFVAASTGNHAAAFAHVIYHWGLKGKVYLPVTVTKTKLQFIKDHGLPYELYGEDCLDTEVYARAEAEKNGYVLVPPYNDPEIVQGQGTIGYEILNQLPETEAVIVPVGGGGLIGGIAAYIKAIKPEIEIIGCQPVNSPEMVESLKRGYIISESITQPTLSDATAGGIEQEAITFELCQKYVDRFVLIHEDEIRQEILWALQHHQMIIEGSAAMSIATLRKNREQLSGKKVVMILCSKRLSYEKLGQLLDS